MFLAKAVKEVSPAKESHGEEIRRLSKVVYIYQI